VVKTHALVPTLRVGTQPGLMRKTAHRALTGPVRIPTQSVGTRTNFRGERSEGGRSPPLVPTRSNGIHTWPDAQTAYWAPTGPVRIPTRSVGTRKPRNPWFPRSAWESIPGPMRKPRT